MNHTTRSFHRIVAASIAMAALPLAASTGCASALQQRFQAHIDYLASDELEGRGVGSSGIELAAEYIAGQFADIGLEPAGENGDYFQSFPMTLRRTLNEDTRLTFAGDSQQRRLRKDFFPFGFSSDEAFDGPVVFCGYGIDAPDKEYSDFAHIDLEGKVALMLRGQPTSWADEAGHHTRHAMLQSKVYNAKDRKAVAVLIVNRAPQDGESDELIEFESEGGDAYGIPAFHVTRTVANAFFARAGLDPLNEMQRRLDAGSSASAVLAGVTASGQAVFTKHSAPARNVLGILRGAGPLADEYVVIGAHYDHLGIRKPMMRSFSKGKIVRQKVEPQIHNGADDNASGTSGLIEVARMLAEGPTPKRSVVFIAFTAEESGLHGSKYYTDHPYAPLDSTVAMLNMDMIGRMDNGSRTVTLFGVESGKEFGEIVAREAAATGLKTAKSNDTGGRSDHAPFIRNNIPAMHFFSGHHSDYHKPSDDSDKINARDGVRVLSFVGRTALSVANLGARPTFEKVKADAPSVSGGTPTYRVVMGLAPGYGDDGKPGMAVEAVSAEGPADVAGMKAGDHIIRIDDKEVGNIYDYMAATRNNNPGDTVTVVVSRKGKEVTLKVTLSGAR